MSKILVLEDNPKLSKYYFDLLSKADYQVLTTKNSTEFFRTHYSFKPDLLILDIKLNNSQYSGLEVYEKLVEANNLFSQVIVLSGEASRLEVAEAMKLGAYTFIEKSSDFSSEKFLNDIKQALKLKEQQEQAISLNKDKEQLRLELMGNSPLIGKSSQMMHVKEKISRFARNDIDVLIEGETGTGKDIVAKQIYLQSERIGKPYVVVNSGGISETLIDSELFGHKKGSFTGAYSDKKGFFEQADKGILFMDEISNLDMSVQAKILRAIEQKEVRVVGGKNKIVDVRLIFASNKKLQDMVSQNKFRKDLFYRLDGNIITIPPLRERGDDIVILFEYFSSKYSEKHHCSYCTDCSSLKKDLSLYHWPGNVRELERFTQSLFVMHDMVDNKIVLKALNFKKNGKENISEMSQLLSSEDFTSTTEEFEKQYIEHQLKLNNYKVSTVAKKFGMDRTTLYKKIKKYNLNHN